MERDRNLLFGIFAVQIKGVTPKQIVEAAAAWAVDQSVPLSRRLVNDGALSDDDVVLIDQLVDAAVQAHSGDASRALESLGGEERVDKTFYGSIVLRPSGGLETRAMASDSFLGEPAPVLSTIEEFPGRYSHVSEYGRGGMGRVLLVHDEHLGRQVALKELLLPKSEWVGPGDSPIQASTAVTARFLQEARLTGRLEHPAIVPVYELGRRQNGTLYYTMKLVRGKTLAKALKECRDLRERLGLLTNFVDLCQAIAYAHSKGVIHRDIKPANVMVGAFGETVVLDWGLAKAKGVEDVYGKELESTMRNLRMKPKPESQAEPQAKPEVTPFETRVGEAVGTPNYMSPEQAEGRISDINERSDVYALGVVLYELLTGRVPFEGPSVDEVLWNLVHGVPQSILSLAPDAPPELIEVCMKAMSKDPKLRYVSAGELAEEIKRFLTGSVVQAYKYTPVQMMSRYYKRHRTMINTIGVGVAALIVLGIYSYVNILQARNREREQRVIAEEAKTKAESAQAAETEARADAEHKGYVSQIRLAQEYLNDHNYIQAREMLWSTPEALRRNEWGLLLSMAYADQFLITTQASSTFCVKYSPDGTRFATLSYPDPPRIYDAESGKVLATCDHTPERYIGLNFSPDGQTLLTTGESGTLFVWETATGNLLHDLKGHIGIVYNAEYNHAGTEFLSTATDGVVRIWDAKTCEQVKTLEPKLGAVYAAHFSPDGGSIVADFEDGDTRVFDRTSGAVRFTLHGNTGQFSPDGKSVCTFVEGNVVALWDAATGSEAGKLAGHRDRIFTAHFSSDSSRLITGSYDRTARLWDLHTKKQLQLFEESERIVDAVFAGESGNVVTLAYNNILTLWNVDTGGVLRRLAADGRKPKNLDVRADGLFAAVATYEGYMQTWDLSSTPWRTALSASGEYNMDFALSPDGKRIAFANNNGVEVRDAKTGAAVKRYTCYTRGNAAMAVAFSPDTTHLAAALDGFTMTVWNLDTDVLECQLKGHTGIILSCAYSPDGSKIVTGSEDNTARIWDAASGAQLVVLQGHVDSVRAVRFSPDGSLVATASKDKTAALWDVASGKRFRVLAGHTNEVEAVIFSHKHDRIITGGKDGTVRVWDTATGAEVHQFKGSQIIDSLAIDYDDRLLSASAHDGKTTLWDVQNNDELFSVRDTMAAGFTNNGAYFMESNRSAVGNVTRWDLPPLNVEKLPGTTTLSWRERFLAYRDAQRAERTAFDPATEVSDTVVLVPTGELGKRLSALSDALPANKLPTGDGYLETLTPVVRDQLRLPERGVVTQVNGVAVGDVTDLKSTLAAAASELTPDRTETCKLAVKSGRQKYTLVYKSTPGSLLEETMEFSQSEALVLLRSEMLMLKAQQSTPLAYKADFSGGLSIQATGEAGKNILLNWKIPNEAMLVALGADPVVDATTCASLLQATEERISTSTQGEQTFSQTFSKGDFSIHKIKFIMQIQSESNK